MAPTGPQQSSIRENLLFVQPNATDAECLDVLYQSSAQGLLLRADLGILDVAWTEKARETKAIEALAAERDAQRLLIDKGFAPLLPRQPSEEDKP